MPLLNNNRPYFLSLPHGWPAAGMLFVLACLLQTPVNAQKTGCPQIVPPSPPWLIPPVTALTDTAIQINADQAELRADEETVFSGHVTLQRDGLRLFADQVTYNKLKDEAAAMGSVLLQDQHGSSFRIPELTLQLGAHVGHTGPGEFTLAENIGRGDAQRIDFEGTGVTRMSRVRYTTCPPGQDSWFLKINRLKLDTTEDVGTAYHASVNFLHIPVFYLPYLSFPISDQRKSGFLIPQIGSSDKLGTVVAAPYYLNLAPDFDDTVTPRLLSKRGLQLQNEFRYLGHNAEGILQLEYLADDDEFNGENRAAGSYAHQQRLTPLWSTKVDVRGVSDKDYLDDFGDNLGITSQTHLPQTAELNYHGAMWNFTASASNYQTVDKTIAVDDRPYARLPHLSLAAFPGNRTNRLQYHFASEVVNFEHESKPTGRRLNLNPAVSYPWTRSYGFVTPKVGAGYIGYDLSEIADDSPSLTRGVFSLDSGLYFDRDTRWGSRGFTQTLEPRLFYLYVPDKNQDRLPNFDTSEPDLSFDNLFRENRFVGGDRIGDANQATFALTTRLLDDEEGVERFRASVGQIYYFDDRKVNIPAGVDTVNSSDIVAETTARLHGNWYVRGNIQHNRDTRDTQKSNIYLQYHPRKNSILNLGRRYIRDEIEQTDISLEWPLYKRWTLRARSIYSQRDDRNVESYAGLEYNACCWAMRLFGNRRLTEDGDHVTSIMFELELTGLAKLGATPVSPLQQGVFSFTNPAVGIR